MKRKPAPLLVLALAGLLLLPVLSLRAAFYWESLTLSSAVTDQAFLIPASEEVALEQDLTAYERSTGKAIVVLTLPNLDGDTIEDAATRIFQKAGIGHKDTNEGVLLLVARDERAARIEVGYGLEGVLPDVTCRRILETDLFPAFREGNYAGGIRASVERMEKILGGDKTAYPGSNELPRPVGILIVVFFLLFFFIILRMARHLQRGTILGGTTTHWGGGFGGGGGFSGGGGFGGFGGGMSGGGGASGHW